MIQIRPVSDLRNKFPEIIEMKLDEADRQAAVSEERLTHETVFRNARGALSPQSWKGWIILLPSSHIILQKSVTIPIIEFM